MVRVTHLHLAQVVENVVTVLGDHADVPGFVLDILYRARGLNFGTGFVELALHARGDAGLQQRCHATCHVAGPERVGRRVTLVVLFAVLVVVVVPLLLGLGERRGLTVGSGSLGLGVGFGKLGVVDDGVLEVFVLVPVGLLSLVVQRLPLSVLCVEKACNNVEVVGWQSVVGLGGDGGGTVVVKCGARGEVDERCRRGLGQARECGHLDLVLLLFLELFNTRSNVVCTRRVPVREAVEVAALCLAKSRLRLLKLRLALVVTGMPGPGGLGFPDVLVKREEGILGDDAVLPGISGAGVAVLCRESDRTRRQRVLGGSRDAVLLGSGDRRRAVEVNNRVCLVHLVAAIACRNGVVVLCGVCHVAKGSALCGTAEAGVGAIDNRLVGEVTSRLVTLVKGRDGILDAPGSKRLFTG